MPDYIRLVTSSGSLDKRFASIFGGFKPEVLPTFGEKSTASGRLSLVVGAHRPMFTHTLIVPLVTTGSHPKGSAWGVYEDLWNLSGTGFFNLKNPSGTPTNKITYYDHDGTQHYVYIVNGFAPVPLSPQYTGANSHWTVPIVLRRFTAI